MERIKESEAVEQQAGAGKRWSEHDLGPLGKLRAGADSPVEIYWMRAINNADAGFFQTQKEHRHSFFELHFVLSGRMEYRYGGESVSVPAEHLLLLPPDEAHCVADFSADFLKLSVAFAVAREEELYAALLGKSGQAIPLSEGIRAALRTCAAEAERDTAYSSVLIAGRVFEILYELADLNERRKRREGDERVDLRLAKAKQFIADNPHVFLGCEDVAGYCYISVKQLSRIFLRYENMTLLAYIHKEKLRAAEAMLKAGDHSVQEISEALGFSSVYYFSAFFTKHTGVTPARYRREISGEA